MVSGLCLSEHAISRIAKPFPNGYSTASILITTSPEPPIQRLPARLTRCSRAARKRAGRATNEASHRPLRERDCERLWESNAAARSLRLVEARDGFHWFRREALTKALPYMEDANLLVRLSQSLSYIFVFQVERSLSLVRTKSKHISLFTGGKSIGRPMFYIKHISNFIFSLNNSPTT